MFTSTLALPRRTRSRAANQSRTRGRWGRTRTLPPIGARQWLGPTAGSRYRRRRGNGGRSLLRGSSSRAPSSGADGALAERRPAKPRAPLYTSARLGLHFGPVDFAFVSTWRAWLCRLGEWDLRGFHS